MDAETFTIATGTSLGVYEGIKRYMPGLLPANVPDEAKALVVGVIGTALLKVAAVGAFATIAWPATIAWGIISVMIAGLAHDKVLKPVADPLLNKLPAQTPKGGV